MEWETGNQETLLVLGAGESLNNIFNKPGMEKASGVRDKNL